MTDIVQAFRAGIDAVIADNTLNRGGFADAIRTVITARFTNAQATAWIDAIAAEYNRLGLINNATYNSLRGSIIGATDAAQAEALFSALGPSINALPETAPAVEAAQLIDLREERDQIDNAIDRCDVLIAAEPVGTVGRMVKDVLRQGKQSLRGHKEDVRQAINNITGDPDT